MADLTRREKDVQAHETEIIDAAEEIFIRKGFAGASIDAIAKAAQFTRRTIYQYFATKEDLFCAVIYRCYRQFFSYLEVELTKDASGFDRLYQAGLAFYRFYLEYPHAVQLINYMGYIKETSKSSPNFRELLELDGAMFCEFAVIVEEGQKDLSIRSDLNAMETACSLAFILTGFFYELSASGKSFTRNLHLNEESFVTNALQLIFRAIKA